MFTSLPIKLWVRPVSEEFSLEKSRRLLEELSNPVYFYWKNEKVYVVNEVDVHSKPADGAYPLVAFDGAQSSSQLGNLSFLQDYHLKYAYLSGGMGNGISSTEMVVSMAKAGMLGFLGSAGLPIDEVEKAIFKIKEELGSDYAYGVNLVSRITDPEYEKAMIDLFSRCDVRIIEASAFITISPALVKYRLSGLREGSGGQIIVPNKILAKTSREEILLQFISPAPPKLVSRLLSEKAITETEAYLAKHIPMAEEIIAEADSGGHTDNRPAILLFPQFRYLVDQTLSKFSYRHVKLRIGAAGGIATPHSILAAFTLGADFVLTGSINQSCLEARTSREVKEILCQTSIKDVACAPSSSMFEMGGRVQVSTRGCMFHTRAIRLLEVFKNYPSIDAIPLGIKEDLEKTIFRDSLTNIWEETKDYYVKMEPAILRKAEENPKTKMALVFRWYLSKSSDWARHGYRERKSDFQIMCGPSMGAFNRWAKGTPLEKPENRKVVDLAISLMDGALYLKRIQSLSHQGVLFPMGMKQVRPKTSSLHGSAES